MTNKLFILFLFVLSFTNVHAIEIDACIDGVDTTTTADLRTNPYIHCARNSKRYMDAGKSYTGLYYIEGRNYPIAYTTLASNHTYIDILDGVKRDNASLCFMFEQLKDEGYDLTKLVSGDGSVEILIGGSESNSFFYTPGSSGNASIDMNNTDYCEMKEDIKKYIDSL